MKKYIALFTSVVLFLALIPAVALAQISGHIEVVTSEDLLDLKVGDRLYAQELIEEITLFETIDGAVNEHDLIETESLAAVTKTKWVSSDTTVLSVATNGRITAKKAGAATLKVSVDFASEQGYTPDTGEAEIEVVVAPKNVAVTDVSVTPSAPTVDIGKTVTLKAAVSPSDATDKTVTWSSANNNIATVSTSGVVTGIGVGTTAITATSTADGSKSAAVNVVVKTSYEPVKSITLTPAVNLNVGGGAQLSWTVNPSNATNKAVNFYSSSPHVASVDSNGYVRANGSGSTTITAYSQDNSAIKAYCYVTVQTSVIPVSSVSVYPVSLNLSTGGGSYLTPTVYPTNATDKKIVYSSSDSRVATVDANGYVRAMSTGTASIYATAHNGRYAITSVSVQSSTVNVQSVKVYPTSMSMSVGGVNSISPSIYPSNATDKRVTYTSSNDYVATVDSSGRVFAKSNGSATIYTRAVADSSKYATTTVTVKSGEVSVQSVSASPTKVTMPQNTTTRINPKVSPSNANQSVNFSSSNEAVATVDANGIVYAHNPGTATIYTRSAQNSAKFATTGITVNPSSNAGTKVKDVTVSPRNMTLLPGQTNYVAATVYPSTAINTGISYSVGNSGIASVDASGRVTAHRPGKTTLYARSHETPSIYSTCIITVEDDGGLIEDDSDDITLGNLYVPSTPVSKIVLNGKTLQGYVIDGAGKQRSLALDLGYSKNGGTQLLINTTGSSAGLTLRLSGTAMLELLDQGVDSVVVTNGAGTVSMSFDVETLYRNAKTGAKAKGKTFVSSSEVSCVLVQRTYSTLTKSAKSGYNKGIQSNLNSQMFESGFNVRIKSGSKLYAYDVTKYFDPFEMSLKNNRYSAKAGLFECRTGRSYFSNTTTANIQQNNTYWTSGIVRPGAIACVVTNKNLVRK